MWKDGIYHYISDLGIKMSIAYTTNITGKARALHDLSPVATAALGRTLTGAILLASDFKNKEGVSIRIEGDGPLGTIYADAYDTNKIRGFVANNHADIPLNKNGKLDVGRAVGGGTLHISRYSLLKQPYQSMIHLVSGEVAEDLAHYLTLSEQVPSAVSLGVLVNKNMIVEAAGGILIQALPDAKESALKKIEQNLYTLGPITNAMKKLSPEDIVFILNNGMDFRLIRENPIFWMCTCSKDKFKDVLQRLPPTDQEDLLMNSSVEMVCHYCNTKYSLSKKELLQLYKGAD